MLSNSVTYDILSANVDMFVNVELRAFVCVRSKCYIRGGRFTYADVPTRKDKLMMKVVELCNNDPNERMFEIEPVPPSE